MAKWVVKQAQADINTIAGVLLFNKGINETFETEFPSVSESAVDLPGGAVQSGGWAAGEVLLDALVVTDLGGNRDGGGFGPWGHHGGLSWHGLRLPGGE